MRQVLALLVAFATACSSAPQEEVRRYQLTGVVAGRDPASGRVEIAHDDIQGFMPAMRMAFEIRGEAPQLRDADRILATLVVTTKATWLENVRITASGGVGIRPAPVSAGAMPGTVVPPLPLVDQDGQPITLRDAAGRVQVITFIYTRCPLPDFCPLMVQHLERVRRRANEATLGRQLAFVGVTLDPAFDTAPVLRAYGDSFLKGADRFEQWTLATGSAGQVGDVARFFGVDYRLDNGLVTHTLVTVVVGADGRVVRTFPSNSWGPDDLFDVVRQAVDREALR